MSHDLNRDRIIRLGAERSVEIPPPSNSRQNRNVVLHQITIGDAVAVFAFDPLGNLYLEGWAFIKAICAQPPHHYRVRFYGERVVRTRHIDPDSQREPKLSRALLYEFWRRNSSESFEEFFSDETTDQRRTMP
jgi:hypothetical protein